MKVDSHVHLWDMRHTPQPWMSDEHASIARPFGPADIEPLLERNGIDSVIVVQGACLDSDTDYLLDEAARQRLDRRNHRVGESRGPRPRRSTSGRART